MSPQASAQPTTDECEKAYQVMFQGMISGSRKKTDAETRWGMSWESERNAGKICGPIPETLSDSVPVKPDRVLSFDKFGDKHFIYENGDTIDIQPYDPARSDCYTAFAAMKFGQEMYGFDNFSAEEYKWRDSAEAALKADGYCPAMSEDIAVLTASYVEHFGYRFAPISTGKPYIHVCDSHMRAININDGTGEAKRWAETYLMAARWKQPSFVREVCDMMSKDITHQSWPYVNKARRQGIEAQHKRDAQRAIELANLPPAPPTLSEQLQGMTEAMRQHSQSNIQTYRCYDNADGKTQTCGYVNR